MQFNRKWGLVDGFAVSLRFIWFISLLVSLWLSDIPGGNEWVVVWLVSVYLIPQLFYLPRSFKPTLYILSEMLLNGVFNVYIVVHFPEAQSNFIIPIFIISLLSTRKSLPWILLACFAVIPGCLLFWGQLTVDSLLSLWMNYFIFFAFGFGFRVFLEQKRQLTEKNRELENYNRQIEKLAIVEERNRMSRELHDTVGHSLIASVIAMEAVEALIEPHPSQAKQRLNELITYARNHLDDFRHTVHQLSMTELKQTLSEIVRQTISEFSKQTGTDIQFEVQGAERIVKESFKLTFLRGLQEALTNAKKHGKAMRITVDLIYTEDFIEMKVNDDGVGHVQLKPGFGIENMRDRVESLGGEVSIVSVVGEGTTLSVIVPVRSV
nr:sensor histidine kinase [Cohnella mopanensis]